MSVQWRWRPSADGKVSRRGRHVTCEFNYILNFNYLGCHSEIRGTVPGEARIARTRSMDLADFPNGSCPPIRPIRGRRLLWFHQNSRTIGSGFETR